MRLDELETSKHNLAVISKHLDHKPKMVNKEDKTIWKSGNWVMTPKTANGLIGGRFSVHEKQAEISVHQGTILDVLPSEEEGRFVIVYKWDPVKVDGKSLPWSMEQARY